MVQVDIEEIIKEWPEEWRNPDVNLSESDEGNDEEKAKGKKKLGEDKGKEKQSESEKRLASQDKPISHARKKRNVVREPYEPQLSLEDYEHIMTSVQDTLEGSMTAIVTLQHARKANLNNKITELKTLLQKAPQMQATPSNVGTLQEDSTSEEGRTRFVQLVPKSVILPSGNLVEQSRFIEVNLVVIPTNTLQIVQIQVQEELHGQEVNTYKKNRKLLKNHEELRRSAEEMKNKLAQERYHTSQMEKMINDLCAEFPHYNIPADVAPQKVKIIVSKAKDLEKTIEKMDAEHKARVAELEARTPGTPPAERQARTQELRVYANMVEVRIEEAQQLINDASQAWTNTEDIDGLDEVRAALQKKQREVDALTDMMKDLLPIERMLKMSEMTKLQENMQKLRVEEAHYMKTLQPWQTRLSSIALKVTEKFSQAKKMQTTITSLLEEQPTSDLINATRESVDHITR